MMVDQLDTQESILTALSDKYMREILSSTMVCGKSVEESNYYGVVLLHLAVLKLICIF